MMFSWRGPEKELCPYCFNYFALKETPFRCTSPMTICPPEPDEVLTRVWKENVPVGKALEPGGAFVRSVRCPSCKHQTTKRLCPHCHMELPHTTGDLRNYIFALIGAKDSGKSHYLAVLITQIRKHLGPDLDLLLEPINDYTIRRFREQFYNPVYQQGRVIDSTKSALVDRGVQKPLVYSLTFSGKGLFGKTRIKQGVVLVFFDTAGEDLVSEDVMSVVNKYIYRSDGIILLIDPLQLNRVRDRLGPTSGLPDQWEETTDVLNRTTRLIERGKGLKPTDVIDIPLAVAFSKFDAVQPLIDAQFQLNAASDHRRGFDAQDFDAVNDEMVALLEQWDSSELVHFAQTRYRTCGFFGLTALGCNPHGTGQIPRVLPRRVEDPFLWLLARNGLIPTAKTR